MAAALLAVAPPAPAGEIARTTGSQPVRPAIADDRFGSGQPFTADKLNIH
jgi:hypothetical protein